MANREPLRVVAIGGGTGLSALLHGLKPYAKPGRRVLLDITAVVTVTDDGGSSGRLSREFDVLPPGDIRSCMVALSEDEALLSRLFQHRFQTGRGLKGHSFGNLFLTALTQIMGDFPEAVRASSEVLKIVGRIYPATVANVALEATLEDGTHVIGETNISRSRAPIRGIRLRPRRVRPLGDTLTAIADADLITLGPGSLYTSLITNLLVRGIPEALAASRATRVFICNLMTQANESLGLTASQHIEKIFDHAGHKIFDCALVNTAPILPATLAQYAREGQMPIEPDLDRIRALGVEPIPGNFAHEGNVLRHDYDRVTETLLQLAVNRTA